MSRFDIAEAIERFRENLLELTNRNPLLNYRRSQRRTIGLIQLDVDQAYAALVSHQRSVRLDPIPEEDEEWAIGPPPIDALLTELLPERFESVAKSVSRDAKVAIEETGINYLHLALGMLRWRDKTARNKWLSAPLILIPVNIERTYDGRRRQYVYKVFWTEDDVKTNLSLCKRLSMDFGIALPEFTDDTLPSQYLQFVTEAVTAQPDWQVLPEGLIGFFSFHKLLMYEDLNPDNWRRLGKLGEDSLAFQVIAGSTTSGGKEIATLYAPDYDIDNTDLAERIVLISDADSSQHSALCDIARGKSLVIEGPPGTGKSQTIVNAIAMAMHFGWRVLFVAEKLAALEVVHQRLTALGLGDFCLQLHSDEASPRRVCESLRDRLARSKHRPGKIDLVRDEMLRVRGQLASYLKETEAPCGPYQEPLHEVVWKIANMRSLGVLPMRNIHVDHAVEGSTFNDNIHLLKAVAAALGEMSSPMESPWWGFEVPAIDQRDLDSINAALSQLIHLSASMESLVQDLCSLGAEQAEWLDVLPQIDLDRLRDLATSSPVEHGDLALLLDKGAQKRADQLIDACTRYHRMRRELAPLVHCDLEREPEHLAPLRRAMSDETVDVFVGQSMEGIETDRALLRTIRKTLAEIQEAATKLEESGITPVHCLREYKRAVYIWRLIRHPVVADGSVDPKLFVFMPVKEFRAARAECEKLKSMHEQVEQFFDLARVPPAEDFEMIIEEARYCSASFIRVFSRRYWGVVRQIQGFAKQRVGWRIRQWLGKLEDLHGFLHDRARFESNQSYCKSLGSCFRGLDTDWEQLAVLLDWVHTARKHGIDADRARTLFRLRDSLANAPRASRLTELADALRRQLGGLSVADHSASAHQRRGRRALWMVDRSVRRLTQLAR